MTLGEALPIRYGKARSESHGVVREETLVYGSSGVIDTFTRTLTSGPTLIIGRKGTVGATYYCPQPCWPIDTVFFAEAPADKDLRFFKYLLDHLQLGRMDRSTAVPGLSRDDYNAMEIFIPEVEEQRLIVSEIERQFSRLDEAVVSLKRVKANLKRYKAAVLKAAVEGTLVPIRNRQTTKIGEVADLVTKGSSPNWQGFNYAEKGVVFVRSQNVGWGNLDLSDVAHLPPAFNEKERKSVLKTGDVLLNIVGASIGRAALATPDIEGGNVNQAVAVIRLNQERMLPKYLMLNLLSPGTQAAIHAEKVDVARANVSLSDIKEFSVLFPSLAEQGAIIAEVERRLSVIDELEAAVDANLTRADRLRQSVLGNAFSGKLVRATV
jgi:restriction endonuclease S subunit